MARYQLPTQQTKDQNGAIIQSATVSVFLNGTTTPAKIYVASSGGTAVNSVTSSATDGTYTFWVDTADYGATQLFDLVFSKTNFSTLTYRGVYVFPSSSYVVDNDPTLSANSPTNAASQQATKTYADTKISHSLATEANDFLVSSGVGVFVKKTLAQVQSILGLGTAAFLNTGTSANNVVQLDSSGKIPAVNGSNLTGMGTAAFINVGTSANQIVQLDSSGKLPAVDGSQLLGLSSILPVGIPMMWCTEIAPTGTLEGNGASLLRASYANLFAVYGTMFGAVDSTHFNLPDMRGYIARFWDHGAGRDPDRASRTVPSVTGATMVAGDHVGTVQQGQVGPHTHVVLYSVGNSNTGTGLNITNPGRDATTVDYPVGSNGTSETRPINMNFMAIIKY